MPEIFNKRFVASFMFDAIYDPSKIATSGNEAFQHYCMALLCDFIKGDPEKIKRLIAQTIALEMENWSTGTIEESIASPVIEDANVNALSIFDAFKVQLVSSQLQEAIPTNIVDATPAIQINAEYDDDIDSGDDYWGPIVRIEDEDELIMQRVSADEIFDKGFTKFLAEYREAEAQREAKQQ